MQFGFLVCFTTGFSPIPAPVPSCAILFFTLSGYSLLRECGLATGAAPLLLDYPTEIGTLPRHSFAGGYQVCIHLMSTEIGTLTRHSFAGGYQVCIHLVSFVT